MNNNHQELKPGDNGGRNPRVTYRPAHTSPTAVIENFPYWAVGRCGMKLLYALFSSSANFIEHSVRINRM